MERQIDKVRKVYKDSLSAENEAYVTFIKDAVYPKIEEAASTGKTSVYVTIPEDKTTINALRFMTVFLNREGFEVYLSEKEGKLRFRLSGWATEQPVHTSDLLKMLFF